MSPGTGIAIVWSAFAFTTFVYLFVIPVVYRRRRNRER